MLLYWPVNAQYMYGEKPRANVITKTKTIQADFKPRAEPQNPKDLQYLDYQYITGYTFSPHFNSPMNMHPEIGIGIGFKKEYFTLGVTGTFRFIKTREAFAYYVRKDTFSTRFFSNLAFGFYYHQPLFNENGKEFFFEVAPGFEVLTLERTAPTYTQSRATAISFSAMGGLGFRLLRPRLRYYQLATNVNYNNFSYGKSTDIPPQIYFNIRLTFGFLVKDNWAMKKNYGKN